MKMTNDTMLFRVLSGSRLYGTATESSDYDYKAICLPSLDSLLLNKRLVNKKERPAGLSDGDKMLAGESETEYLPLQVFFEDFFAGQSYAIEIAFATAQGLHETSVSDVRGHAFYQTLMQELVDKFLTNNVKKMVGYAVSQSKLYGLKTQRYTSIKSTIDAIQQYYETELLPDVDFEGITPREYAAGLMKTWSLEHTPKLLELLLSFEHVKKTTILNARGGQEESPAIDVCGKVFPLTNKWSTLMASLNASLEKYGTRVKEFDGEGVDWKAFSHAVRITNQVLELSSTGKMVFPCKDAEMLRDMKSGKYQLDVATAIFEKAFSKVDDAVDSSVLQTRTPELEVEFNEWKIAKLREMYGLQQS